MQRREALKGIVTLSISLPMTSLHDLKNWVSSKESSDKMPVLFVGHGNPMNVLWDNAFTRHLSALGQRLEAPKAVLVISAHWLSRGTHVATNPAPPTIHDFGGFPSEMYEIQYPAPGAPDLAMEIAQRVHFTEVHTDEEMGLDHGAWTVLRWMYPEANIPVFQMSIDATQGPTYHYALAKDLAFLRKRGVMILGSGNIVHNLRILDWQNPEATPFDWAKEFDEKVKTQILNGDHQPLIDYLQWGTLAKTAVPTNDHYLPMLYTLGLKEKSDEVSFTYEGFHHGSISMRCIQLSS
ncbi:4,5-DOPA-extradiol-dioxygenase [Shiella aurantiaca]|nr:4,5-DOPA dioxygenase extradiol [Shiella aurantiaca]